MSNIHNKNNSDMLQKGFSLVELLFSIGIITIIMTIVLFNFSQFNETLALKSAAQEVAIAMRQTQIYGLAVKDSGGGQFNYAYGIFFDDGDSKVYHIFVDKDGDSFYDVGDGCGGVNTECVERININNGVIINDICNTLAGGACNIQYRRMAILFKRPDTTPITYFYSNLNSNKINGSPARYGRVKLTLENSTGQSVSVTVADIGQVIIE